MTFLGLLGAKSEIKIRYFNWHDLGRFQMGLNLVNGVNGENGVNGCLMVLGGPKNKMGGYWMA